jgi:hypothetical protein
VADTEDHMIDIDGLKGWIGREECVEDSLALFPARALAAALDHALEPSEGDPLPPVLALAVLLERAFEEWD